VIEEKLKAARLRSAKRRMQIGIGLFVAICLGGLWVFALSFVDISPKKDKPLVEALPKEQQPAVDMEKLRGELKAALQQYEREIEPRLKVADVQSWPVSSEIDGLKQKVMENFGNGDYGLAMDNLGLLNSLALKVLKEADQIFLENLEKAKQFLADNLYDGAKFHIEKALKVNGQSPEALQVQVEIEKLVGLLPLLNGAAIARTENDLQKEYEYLQQVLKIAPERDGVKARLNEIRDRIQTQKFESHIASGFDNIANRQPQKARSHYEKARQIDSKRAELSLLLAQILDLEKSVRIKLAVSQAEQALRQDDWEQVKLNFERVSTDAPENRTVVEGLRRADHILSLQARLNQFLKAPYHLAHPQVLNEAQQTLAAAKAASGDSFTLKRTATQLSELITQVNRVIPVTIISDNQTYVLVRSVGKVGVLTQKIIQLKPGNYTFEGTRNGFKSKLLPLLIPYDQNQFSVRVICDESI